MVRYHLAIDERPKDIPKREPAPGDPPMECSLCHQDIYAIKQISTGLILRYSLTDTVYSAGETSEKIAPKLEEVFADCPKSAWFNWREELYRQALLAYGTSTQGSYYDEELLAEWRNLYDPMNQDFKSDWEAQFGTSAATNPNSWTGYNVDVRVAPNKIRYWLDIIDTSSAIGKYSVSKIGRRTKVEVNSSVNEVFPPNTPSVVFMENTGDYAKMLEDCQEFIRVGQDYSFVNSEVLS